MNSYYGCVWFFPKNDICPHGNLPGAYFLSERKNRLDSNVTTTEAHLIEESRVRAGECIADVMLRGYDGKGEKLSSWHAKKTVMQSYYKEMVLWLWMQQFRSVSTVASCVGWHEWSRNQRKAVAQQYRDTVVCYAKWRDFVFGWWNSQRCVHSQCLHTRSKFGFTPVGAEWERGVKRKEQQGSSR